MSPVQPNNLEKLINLKQASELLGVSIETLLSWNQHNILKPTITVEGEIGYTQNQIHQFLTIRQLTQKHETQQQPKATETPAYQSAAYITPQPYVQAMHTSPVSEQPKTPGRKSRSSKLLLSFAVLIVLTSLAVLPQLVTPLPEQKVTDNKVLGSQTSKLNISKQANGSLPIQIQNEKTIKNLNNEGESISKEKIVAPSLYEAVNTKDTNNQTPTVAKPRPGDIATTGATSDLASIAYFDTCTNCTDDNDSAIDARGNIKGDTDKTNTLAAVVGDIDSMVKTDSSKHTSTDATNQLIFLSLGFLAVLYVFQKQFAYATRKSPVVQKEPYRNPAMFASQKVLEVGQKTDGTVVLLVRGKEYKISKPEMNSESDQFIERLMTLTQADMKEIEYDTLKADKVYLTTPLSRLVTRLGFVGVKRDLFFPRTSKNSVLFRKYLTEADLASMNLTTDKILNEMNLLS